MADAGFWAVFIVFGVLAIAAFGIILVATRYKRCASDEILVVYGRIRGGKASRCIHGGAVMVWPLIQEYKKISLIPMTISIPLDNALSLQHPYQRTIDVHGWCKHKPAHYEQRSRASSPPHKERYRRNGPRNHPWSTPFDRR